MFDLLPWKPPLQGSMKAFSGVMGGSFYAKHNSEIYVRGMMGQVLRSACDACRAQLFAAAIAFTFVSAQKDDRAVREEMMGSGRRVPIGTCPSLDYAQRIRRQYKNLSGQTTAQVFVSREVSPSFFKPCGYGRGQQARRGLLAYSFVETLTMAPNKARPWAKVL